MSNRTTWKNPACPYCKGLLKVTWSTSMDENDPDIEWAVKCSDCNLTGPVASTKTKAINKWKYKHRADGTIRKWK